MTRSLDLMLVVVLALQAPSSLAASWQQAPEPLIAQFSSGAVRCFCGGPVDCPIHRAPSSTSSRPSYSTPSRSVAPSRRTQAPGKPIVLPSPFELQKQEARKEASGLNEEALEMAKQEKWDEAIALFKKALDKYPDYDEDRKKLRDNIEWAEKERALAANRQKELGLALGSVKDFVANLGSPFADLREQPAPKRPSESAKTTVNPTNIESAKPPRQLPLPSEIAALDLKIKAIQDSPSIPQATKDQLVKEYQRVRAEFITRWQKLSDVYTAYIDADTEYGDLKRRIEAHNLQEPGEGDQLQKYNDDARLLYYQMSKLKTLRNQTDAAFDEAVKTLVPQVDQFLASPGVTEDSRKFDQALRASSAPPVALPVVDVEAVRGAVETYGKSGGSPIVPPPADKLDELIQQRLSEKHDPPVLRGKQGAELLAAIDELEGRLQETQLGLLKEMHRDFQVIQKMKSEEIDARLRPLQREGLFIDNRDLAQKYKTSRFLHDVVNDAYKCADEAYLERKAFLENMYRNKIRRETRRVMGFNE